jgi:coproporphyrinogen III oxidase
MICKEDISEWFGLLQDKICHELEEADGGAKFHEDKWKREEGGGGRTRIIKKGNVIEKGGVAYSAVHGPVPDFLKRELKSDISQSVSETFYATGISIVIHPFNPMVPIIHMNVRYFEISSGEKWFGGGIDLTPHYVQEADARYFHGYLKKICESFDPLCYEDFKKRADDYFFISHRNETRGIGGIFFDHLKPDVKRSFDQIFNFVKAVGESFSPLYTHFMNRNNQLPFSENEKQWQLLRRGRYVEFNLVYDRGTRFGLETNGRTESILMSLPPMASWTYNFLPGKESREEQTLALLRKGINWVY